MDIAGIKAKPEERFKDVRVSREGTKIIIPEGMDYAEARTWLTRQEEAEEKQVAIHDRIPCYPLDGIVSLMLALKQVYGFASLESTRTFFGDRPPLLVQVPLGNNKFETAPIGRIAIPKWEGGYIETIVQREAALIISGSIKRKFEGEVKQIIALTRDLLKEHSIYKGRAVMIDLQFMADEQRGFHPVEDAPKFMEVEGIDEAGLILNDVTKFELDANIFTLIERTQACLENGIPLKHGCLLMGPYGTGKTLTARVMAKKCVVNGWTFIYLKNTAHLANALRIAQLYAPAVVFSEDVDQVVTGNRDGALNEILNTLDGVDTKDKPIITILTTNNAGAIEPAFLRAGRIDTVIQMDAPDAKTAVRFVERFARDDEGRSLLVSDTNLDEAGKELAGYVPAFISEAVQKAKRFAIHREGASILGKLSGGDIALAAKALKKHVAMVNRKPDATDEQIVAAALRAIRSYEEDGEVWREGIKPLLGLDK